MSGGPKARHNLARGDSPGWVYRSIVAPGGRPYNRKTRPTRTRGRRMLAEPDRTAYDLNFRLLGFPVRVHPLFWLVSVIFGANALEAFGAPYLFIWVAVVFVSILVHELGHALVFRACGVGASVVLYSFGGLAVPWGHVAGRWRRVGVSLAGPAAGFVLAALVWASNYWGRWAGNLLEDGPTPGWFFYRSMMFVNVAWGAVNLLPVLPLDGGRVSEEVCEAASRRNGRRLALQISIVVALLVAGYSLACVVDRQQPVGWLAGLPDWVPRGSVYTALFFGALAYSSYQLLQHTRWTDSHWDRDY